MLTEILTSIGFAGPLMYFVEFLIVLGAGKAVYDYLNKDKK